MSETVGTHVRLRDALKDESTRGREIETAIAMAMHGVVTRYRIDAKDALRGLAGNIVAVIMARTQTKEEAREVGEEVCAAILRRLTDH